MDSAPIQYVTTSDGVNIAYYTMEGGGGLPIVSFDLPSHLQADRRLDPRLASYYRALSHAAALTKFDPRGFGLSDRDIGEFPLDAMVKDLEAVVDALAMDNFVLMALRGLTGPVAVTYAAAHPDRVAKLVLSGSFANVSPLQEDIEAVVATGNDWRFVSEAIVRRFLGWDEEAASRAIAAYWREASTFDTFKTLWRDAAGWDSLHLLPKLTAPTLLLAVETNSWVGVESARETASLLPHAQLVVVEGRDDDERRTAYATAIATFLFGPDAYRQRRQEPLPSGTAIILFADIVDSTVLTERLGDTAFREKARDVAAALRSIIADNGGRTIEGPTLGDGVLATFTSAREAIEAAQRCAKAGDDAALPLHLGLHAGDVTREKDPGGRDNVYGGAVNVAARISGLSAAGEVLVSETVRSLARTSAGVGFEDRGEQHIKGVGEPVRVWAVTQTQ